MLKDSTILLFIVYSAVGFYRKAYSTLQNTRVFCQIYDHEFHLIELGRKLDKNSSRIRIHITGKNLFQIWYPAVKTALDPGSGSATLMQGFWSGSELMLDPDPYPHYINADPKSCTAGYLLVHLKGVLWNRNQNRNRWNHNFLTIGTGTVTF